MELRRFDALDHPAAGEGVVDLGSCHSARAPTARLVIAEAQHVIAAVRPDGTGQALDEPWTVGVVEHVEQPAVEDRVGPLAE